MSMRTISKQIYCGCSICFPDELPLNENDDLVCKCKCLLVKLNKSCWNLRRCKDCEIKLSETDRVNGVRINQEKIDRTGETILAKVGIYDNDEENSSVESK